ncbi:MAG TPA: hypothetical protein VKA34_06775 [Balneolales bacterium]|nr:hypothetical protein [Balneolales bacterium]
MLRKSLLAVSILLITVVSGWGQSIKKVKTEVTFKNLGELTTINTTKIDGTKEREDKDTEAKGHGIVNNVLAKVFLKSGSEGEITDLDNMLIYKMNHKKKEYSVIPIEKYTADSMSVDEPNGDQASNQSEKTEDQGQQDQKEESDVKLVRHEFKVEKTNDSKNINGFNCNRYTIMWLTEWQNVKTKETSTDSLFTNVWTTPVNGNIKKAQSDEAAFNQLYMKKLGFEFTDQQKQLLGMEWISLFNKMKQSENDNGDRSDLKNADFSQMNKIQGYPVVVDGSFFVIAPQKQEAKKEEKKKKPKSVRGLFGRLAKKAVKKELSQPKETGPDIHFYTEVLELKPVSLDESVFQVPQGYKKQ